MRIPRASAKVTTGNQTNMFKKKISLVPHPGEYLTSQVGAHVVVEEDGIKREYIVIYKDPSHISLEAVT